MTTKPMKLLLVIAMSLIGTIACAQQHAPLAAQCRADVRLWANERVKNEYFDAEQGVDKGLKDDSAINQLNIHELTARSHELIQCKDVDPGNAAQYREAVGFYQDVLNWRRQRFFERHMDLYDLLVNEDVADER